MISGPSDGTLFTPKEDTFGEHLELLSNIRGHSLPTPSVAALGTAGDELGYKQHEHMADIVCFARP